MGEGKFNINKFRCAESTWAHGLHSAGVMRSQIVIVLTVFVNALVLSANAWGIDLARVLAKSISPNPYYWAGHKAKLEGDNRFTIEIKYLDDGKNYEVTLGHDWQRECSVLVWLQSSS